MHIVTGGDMTREVEIGAPRSGIYFMDDPVEITSEVNDTFDHLLRHSATVRLLSAEFRDEFFGRGFRDAKVNICRNGACLFAGYIEPQAYSQPFAEVLDEIELNCIDALSALQYLNYKNVGTAGVLYDVEKSEAAVRSFGDIVLGILDGVTEGLAIGGGASVRYLYDGSKLARKGDTRPVFERLTISESLFFGDGEDDLWKQEEVLEEILRYLNLHIMQTGTDFYVFDWQTVKNDGGIPWMDLKSGTRAETTVQKLVTIKTEIAADCDTSTSIGEVYNRILATCDVDKIDNVIESPLEESYLETPYPESRVFMTEYRAVGEGTTAYSIFYRILHDKLDQIPKNRYSHAHILDWYALPLTSKNWVFPRRGGTEEDIVPYHHDSGHYAGDILDDMHVNRRAALFSFGSVDKQYGQVQDNSLPRLNMSNYLVVCTSGNENDSAASYEPGEGTLRTMAPVAKYTGTSEGVFSAADDGVVNYIIFTGRIKLMPIMKNTDNPKILCDTTWYGDDGWRDGGHSVSGGGRRWWHQTVYDRDNGDGSYRTVKYWDKDGAWIENRGSKDGQSGFTPDTDNCQKSYEFKYSAKGDSTDMISKVGVLSCMLIIGDKCVVETGTDGKPSDFTWQKYKTREQCGSDDEYYAQSFSIGFDPKIGDKLIGTDFDIQNNIDHTLHLDEEGMAIPIRRSDHVSGKVQFMILGPYNIAWDEVTRRHGTWFRKTTWGAKSIPLLAHVSGIFIKDFEVKVVSDNGKTETVGDEDNDILYMSDTNESFSNEKDDIGFRINSALTSEECRTLGIRNYVARSTPQSTLTEEPVLTIYDVPKGAEAKPEKLYVDSYYREYHLPRVIMEQKLTEDDSGYIGYFNHYLHPAMPGKIFFVQGISRNLMEGRADMVLKETDK